MRKLKKATSAGLSYYTMSLKTNKKSSFCAKPELNKNQNPTTVELVFHFTEMNHDNHS